MGLRWIRVDHRTITLYYLDQEDECYYAREYVSRGGYAASEANQLIHNLKKPIDRRGRSEWKYKTAAIEQFASELAEMLPPGAFITDIPTSHSAGDPAYDDRLVQVLTATARLRHDVSYVKLLTCRQSIGAAHLGGSRSPDALFPNLNWCGEAAEQSAVFIVDDVIGSGGHFAACKRLIRDHWPQCRVIGVFWARVIEG